MKRFMSLFVAMIMCVVFIIPAYAAQPVEEADTIPTMEEVQKHFPDLKLGESGYIDDIDLYAAEVNINEPVATYSAVDGDDLYYVAVYADNSYITYGLTGGTTGITSGSSSTSGGYTTYTNRRVYVLKYGACFDVNYYVSYKINNSTNRATITSISEYAGCSARVVDGFGNATGSSATPIKSVVSVKQETSSTAAKAYGGAKMYFSGTYVGILRLNVSIKNGSASVSTSEA